MKLNQKALGVVLLIIITVLSMNIRSTELSERAIVEALGIDYNGTYKITAQIYNPQNPQILTGEGENIAQAMEDINRKNAKKLYLSHNSFIALGMECAAYQIENTLTFFQENRETRPDVLVVITDKAENLVNFTSSDTKTPARSIAQILKTSVEKGIMSDMRLFEILRLKTTPTSDYLIPVIAVGENEISPTGTLVFKQNSVSLLLNEEQTLGYNFIKGNIKETFVLENNTPVIIKDLITQTTVKMVDDIAHFNVNISATTTSQISNEIKFQANNVIKTALKENGCDIFEFGKLLRKNYPDRLKEYENWSNNQKFEIFVTAECHIE